MFPVYIYFYAQFVRELQTTVKLLEVWQLYIPFTHQFFSRSDVSLVNKCLNLNKWMQLS